MQFPATLAAAVQARGWFALGEMALVAFGILLGVLGIGLFVAWSRIRSATHAATVRQSQINQYLLAHPNLSVISTDATGVVETFSRGAERLLGFKAAEVVGYRRLDHFHDPEELAARIAQHAADGGRAPVSGFELLVGEASANGNPQERDWRYVRSDGTPVPVQLSITAMRDARNRLTGYLAVATDLTERIIAEQRRRDFDQRWSKIAAQVPGMVFQLRQAPDGRRSFPYASSGIRDLLRLEPADVADDSRIAWSRIHPEDVDRLAESIDRSAASLDRWQREFRVRFEDGSVRWLWGTALPERQPDGAIVWHGFITDDTARKQAEREHEESRLLLQSVFSTVDLGMFVVDVTGGGEFRFVEVNPAYERLTGLRASDIRGRTPRELVPLLPGEMADCLCASFRRGVESPGPIEYEEPFFVRGRLLWWLTRLAPMRDSIGNVVRLVGRSLDITDRKNIELRFQSLTERLQLATEAAQVGIWDYDLSHHRIVWDKRMQALYGLAKNNFDGTHAGWMKFVHPVDAARVGRELRDAVEGRGHFNTSFRVVWSDGQEREICARAHVQRDPAGRAIRMVGVNWDVTTERRAQAEIERARDQAEDLNRQLEEALDRAQRFAQEAAAATVAKSEFLANMSHEIRTPLNAVIGMSGLLLGTELSSEQRELAGTIRSSGDSLLGLINDILDYSKIESGRLDLERRPFDLRECVESALDVIAGRAAEKKIELLYSIEPGVPECVSGDITRLRQVLVNLLSNAVKFTGRGEVFLSVTRIGGDVTAMNGDAAPVRLRFAVHDSGIGIPADRMHRLFKTFSQVDASTTRHFGGTGLGLAISKRLVEMMAGQIWAESTAGRGSTFSFEIEVPPLPAEAKPFASGRVPEFSGCRVLIVDDNATSGRMLCQQAVVWGMVPRAVESAAGALALLAQAPLPAAVLVDLELPDGSGAELIAAMRRDERLRQLPAILMGSRGQGRVSEELAIAGFLTKPVKTGTLFHLLGEVLQGRKVVNATSAQPGENLAAAHPLAILIAEDNPVNQRVATLMLQRLGYRADVVGNGREVLDAVARQTYDLILMDVQMPEMDGIEATRQICGRYPAAARPRIVAMTANASTGDRELCLGAGMDDFLAKPVRAVDLRRALEETPQRFVTNAA